MPSSILALRRMPAVSTNRIGPSSVSTTVSMASRVVPGMSCTTARSSPISRLNRVDLPTFGRPDDGATEKILLGRRRRRRLGAGVGRRSAARAAARRRASSRSPVPRPCRALTGSGSPRPSDMNSQIAASRLASSTLLATTSTGASTGGAASATRLSSSVMPTMASTTKQDDVGSRMARSLCRLTLASSASPPGSQPPVSTSRNGAALPLGLDLLAVAGDAGLLLDDGVAAADDAVEERRLADVGAPDDGDDRRQLEPASSTRSRARAQRRGRRWPRSRPGGAGRRAWCRRGTGPATGTRRAAGSGGRRARRASTRARSSPTSRPVTPMLPPKNSLSTGTTRTSSRPRRPRSGCEHPGAVASR